VIQVRKLHDRAALEGHLAELGVRLPFHVEPASVLGRPLDRLANRFAILPMEGWDATDDGRPTDLVRRRWSRFGASGAALVWGEAVAVRDDGRANANQLLMGPHVGELRALLGDDQLAGIQLTHSGRYSHAGARLAYAHPLLDRRRPGPVLTDTELDDLRGDYVTAAAVARDAGFDFVDVKACHGYLGHELLSGVDRPGPYGGDLAGRTAFLRGTVDAIGREVGIEVAVRISAFDVAPYDDDGRPESDGRYRYAFGGDGTGTGIDLDEPVAVLRDLVDLGVGMVCITAGSPYYCPHVQRPAFFPPSDGYDPPEDPLVGVARLLDVTARLKAAVPELVVVGSGYSYLQEWLPQVGAGAVADGGVDVVGIGRMALSYPNLPADVLAGEPLERRLLCRTFSDCTTAPRNGLVSGCWPLDDFYKSRPERSVLAAAKKRARS
jgi:NADPH2 dehydrogenase